MTLVLADGAADPRLQHNTSPVAKEVSMVMEVRRPVKSGTGSGLAIVRGVALVVVALFFGFVASVGIPDVPSHHGEYPTQLADNLWRGYFIAMLALSVVALVLGVLSFIRPAAHPVYPVIAGAATILVGLAGCVLGFLFVGNGSDMGTPLGLMFVSFFFASGGALVTVLSVVALLVARSSR
jgi:MFS family permease